MTEPSHTDYEGDAQWGLHDLCTKVNEFKPLEYTYALPII